MYSRSGWRAFHVLRCTLALSFHREGGALLHAFFITMWCGTRRFRLLCFFCLRPAVSMDEAKAQWKTCNLTCLAKPKFAGPSAHGVLEQRIQLPKQHLFSSTLMGEVYLPHIPLHIMFLAKLCVSMLPRTSILIHDWYLAPIFGYRVLYKIMLKVQKRRPISSTGMEFNCDCFKMMHFLHRPVVFALLVKFEMQQFYAFKCQLSFA